MICRPAIIPPHYSSVAIGASHFLKVLMLFLLVTSCTEILCGQTSPLQREAQKTLKKVDALSKSVFVASANRNLFFHSSYGDHGILNAFNGLDVYDVTSMNAHEVRPPKFCFDILHGGVNRVAFIGGVNHDIILQCFYKQQVAVLDTNQAASIFSQK